MTVDNAGVVSRVRLEVEVAGKVKGAQRPRAFVRGKHASVHMSGDHVEAERRITVVAREEWGSAAPLDEAVGLTVVTWHAPPKAVQLKRNANRPAVPYTGKPDADNVAKLVMDALTRAGVWRDDTLVARLTVIRWWLPLGEDSRPVGLERVRVLVTSC